MAVSVVRLALPAMATRFELLLADDRPAARAAGEAALERIRETEQRLSAFRSDSLTSRLNRAGGAPQRIDDEFLELLRLCAEVHAGSAGAFDPSVGGLLRQLGFRGPPDGVRARPGADFARVHWCARTHTVTLPAGLLLDFGAVGKGWALDAAAEALRQGGVERALLHGGTSSVLALASPPDAPAWRVAVADPQHPGRSLTQIELRDQALGVSALHGRSLERAGRRLGHVLDPRSGAPVAHTALAACTHASAAAADAWSTALLVLGSVPAGAPLPWTLIHRLPVAAANGAPHADHDA